MFGFSRYLVKKTVEGYTNWLVVTETDAGEVESWSDKREEGTPLLKDTADLWIWDLGGELDAVD
jgi:hypothetical protein